MNKKLFPIYLSILFFALSTVACHRHDGVGCEQDKYNDWKKIEANRKQQMKSPHDPSKGSNKKVKPKVYGNGITP